MIHKNINFDHILLDVGASNKKQLHKHLAQIIAKKLNVSEQKTLIKMVSQDKKHDIAIGNGVAITKISFSEITAPQIILARLKNSDDFDTPDNLPVDLYCIVIAPQANTGVGLQLMSSLSRVMNDAFLCDQMRCMHSEEEIFQMMNERQIIRRAA